MATQGVKSQAETIPIEMVLLVIFIAIENLLLALFILNLCIVGSELAKHWLRHTIYLIGFEAGRRRWVNLLGSEACLWSKTFLDLSRDI